MQLQIHFLQPGTQVLQLDIGNGANVLGIQAVEDHRFVDAVEEFGAEMRFQLPPHRVLDLVGLLAHHGLDHVRANVAGHDDHGVLKVHSATLAIGQAAIVQHLQQHVEHVGMGFFHLVEQQHAVRLAAHRLGQVATFFIAYVARRRTNQACHAMLFHKFGHIHAQQVLFAVKQKAGQRLAQLGLAHAGGA